MALRVVTKDHARRIADFQSEGRAKLTSIIIEWRRNN